MGQEATEQNGLSGEFQKTTPSLTINTKRIYSKEFLLSVAELDDCKRVPAGFDSSLLRENQPKLDEKGVAIPGASSRGLIHTMRENDAHSASPPDVPEWRRPSSLPGSPFLKPGSRQAEPKVSSPRPGPTRAGNNPARSIMGRSGSARWDMRSNGEDRDRDVSHTQQLDWEVSSPTEAGGRFHSRGLARSGLVVSQEHDGLLGSGGPIVQRGMIQTPTHERHRADRTSRIRRAGEHYHSTHGGKVLRNVQGSQLSRREENDALSDETFNLDDGPNMERSEQERQRRDKFEQMRMELRKKPLITARNNNDTWLGEGLHSTDTFLSSSPGTPQSCCSKDDALKSQNKLVTTSSTPRLPVPPGFSKPNLPKIGSPKENHETGKSVSYHTKDDADSLKQTSSTDGVKLDTEDQFSSLLMKLNQLEDENLKTCSPSQSPVMSKFARWFPSQGPPRLKESRSNLEPLPAVTQSEDQHLFSEGHELNEDEINVVSKLSAVTSLKNKGSVLPMPVGPSLEDVEKVMTATSSGQLVKPSTEGNENNQDVSDSTLSASESDLRAEVSQTLRPLVRDVPGTKNLPVFLTCEDLEQSLLSESVQPEVNPKLGNQDVDNTVNLMHLLELGSSKPKIRSEGKGWVSDEHDLADVMDGSASTHLLSLLRKNGGGISPLQGALNTLPVETCDLSTGQDEHVGDQSNTAEMISLETLFGRKFVNELRTVAEPVSSKQLVDGSLYTGKEETLINNMLFNNSQARRSGQADPPIYDEPGWKSNGCQIVAEAKGLESTLGSGLQDDPLLIDVSVHGHPSIKTTKILHPSRNVTAANDLSFSDGRHRKDSHYPQQGSYSHAEHHVGQRHQISETASHRLHLEAIQDPHVMHGTSMYGMGMILPNGLLYPSQEEFLQAGNGIPGHLEERVSGVSGTYRVPSSASADHPKSVQMGFNLSHSISDPWMGASQINPLAGRWFPGEHVQVSQGFAGFNPYQQHQRMQERKQTFGVSGVGLGPAGSYNIGGLPDRRGHSEISYDHYTLSGKRPSYG